MRIIRPFMYAAILLLPLAASAQGTGSQEFAPLLPSLPGIQSLQSGTSFADFFSNLYRICIGLAAVISVLQLIRAGVLYMGGDSVTEKKQARDLIGSTLGGLLL